FYSLARDKRYWKIDPDLFYPERFQNEDKDHQPYGLNAGENGQCGKNLLKRVDGRLVNLDGKSSVQMEPGVSHLKIEYQRNE
ncbi:unnamed protein product, partial [Didymodactylos carnosus]